MGKDFKIKEDDPARIKRWLNTPRDAYGMFVGTPNAHPIDPKFTYYGDATRARIKTPDPTVE
jgi:hypothetical protein